MGQVVNLRRIANPPAVGSREPSTDGQPPRRFTTRPTGEFMRVAIEAASLALTSGGLVRYTSELSLALAREFPDDEFLLLSDQPFRMPPGAPANLKRGGGPRSAVDRRR